MALPRPIRVFQRPFEEPKSKTEICAMNIVPDPRRSRRSGGLCLLPGGPSIAFFHVSNFRSPASVRPPFPPFGKRNFLSSFHQISPPFRIFRQISFPGFREILSGFPLSVRRVRLARLRLFSTAHPFEYTLCRVLRLREAQGKSFSAGSKRPDQ